jgi:dolichol-phosphate mannosyltransferase
MIIFALPAYNEEKNILELIESIDRTMLDIDESYKLLVVNDGSTDNTLDVLSKFDGPLKIFNHESNKGLPTTIFDALYEAFLDSKPNDIIITMDADNTHDPMHSVKMIEKIRQGHNIVVASRYQNGGQEIGLSFKRHILSKGINTILKVVFPIKEIRDYTCGYRAYDYELLKEAFETYGDNLVETQSFVCMSEILIKLRKFAINGCEVPLVLRYDRKIGNSKMDIKKTIIEYFSMIFKNM